MAIPMTIVAWASFLLMSPGAERLVHALRKKHEWVLVQLRPCRSPSDHACHSMKVSKRGLFCELIARRRRLEDADRERELGRISSVVTEVRGVMSDFSEASTNQCSRVGCHRRDHYAGRG